MAMAQTILLSSPSLPSFNPPSPDPTPLRMLAFSVAEAALQGDPNSPMTPDMSRVPAHCAQDEWKESRLARWCADPSTPSAGVAKETQTIATRRGKPLWEIVERAKERREKSSPSTIDSPLPTSPDSYSFVLPTNSYLAASITTSPSPSPSAVTGRKQFPFPLYTRSAEPSPNKSTFSALDQTRPPPEFQPKQRRLSAADFASSVPLALPSPTQRLQAQALTRLNYPSPSRHTAKTKLPSLAEIQRKLNHPTGTGHRRSGSGGQLPLRRSDSTSTDGDGDEALIQTPEEELKSLALVDDVVIRRSATPPSLGHGPGVESRLAPFLRQRTSGRLVAGDKVRGRPATMPPISLDEDPISVFAPTLTLTVTPPSATPSARALGRVPPPSARRPVFTTPPRPTAARAAGTGPASPTGSDSALTARSSSPTLSIPIITCTPAQQADSDSDSDGSSENDVIVFDGELEKEERSRRGQEMKDRLLLARRRSLH